jgi:hypothetical protein
MSGQPEAEVQVSRDDLVTLLYGLRGPYMDEKNWGNLFKEAYYRLLEKADPQSLLLKIRALERGG